MMDTYLKNTVARALMKIIDGSEVMLIVDEASDKRFLENLVEIIKGRYQGESLKIIRRLEKALEEQDPSIAKKLRRAARK